MKYDNLKIFKYFLLLSADLIEETGDHQSTTAVQDPVSVADDEQTETLKSTDDEMRVCMVLPETAADYVKIIRESDHSGLLCPICNADFATKFALIRHIETVHCGKSLKKQRTTE